jgi:hypothetical protein
MASKLQTSDGVVTAEQVRRWCATHRGFDAVASTPSGDKASPEQNPFVVDAAFVSEIVSEYFPNHCDASESTRALCLHAHGHTASTLLSIAARSFAFDCDGSSQLSYPYDDDACTILYQLSFALQSSGLATQVVTAALMEAVDVVSTEAVDTKLHSWCYALVHETSSNVEVVEHSMRPARAVLALLVRAFPGQKISGQYLLQLLDQRLEPAVALLAHVIAAADTHRDVALHCVRILSELVMPQSHFSPPFKNRQVDDLVAHGCETGNECIAVERDESKYSGEYALGSMFLQMRDVAAAFQTAGVSEVLAEGLRTRLIASTQGGSSPAKAAREGNAVLSHLLAKARDNVAHKSAKEPARSIDRVGVRESTSAVLVHHVVLAGVMDTLKAVMGLQPGDGWDFRAYLCYGATLRKLCVPYLTQVRILLNTPYYSLSFVIWFHQCLPPRRWCDLLLLAYPV